MHFTKLLKSMRYSISLAASLVLISGAVKAEVDLAAVENTWTSSTGEVVTMWGFIADPGSCPAPGTAPAWDLGPTITEGDLETNGDLIINLRNCLAEGVSIIIPGQAQPGNPVKVDGRITAFTQEAATGGTATYTWPGVASGTYLYQSGSYVAKQVHMGLYGVLKIGEYAGTSGEVTLVYSEIDPNLHAQAAAATPLNYKPSYFLINGKEQPAPVVAGDLTNPIALNFLNAGLDFHVPAIVGEYFTLIAEDGNAYPFEKQEYSVNLPAGKTRDAFWSPTESGTYPIFDRRGHGMPASLVVADDVNLPFAQNDKYGLVNFGGELTVATADGVLANDYLLPATPAVAWVSGPGQGTVICAPGDTANTICADGSFTYTPTTAGFNGVDSFVYEILDGTTQTGSTGTVFIEVNAGPDAADDSTTVWRKSKPNRKDKGDPPGTNRNKIDLLANDTDISTIDPKSVTINLPKKRGSRNKYKTPNKGIVKDLGNGVITYNPKDTFVGTDTFTYTVKDIQGAISNEATVTITVVQKLTDLPPLSPATP
jgi:FtsP/CotA-like multicopper oxidase with cupredoxin domain